MVALAFRLPRKSDPSDLWLSTQGTCREGGRIQPLRHPLDSRGLGSTWVHAGVGDLGLEVMQLLGQAVGISGGWQGMGRHPPPLQNQSISKSGTAAPGHPSLEGSCYLTCACPSAPSTGSSQSWWQEAGKDSLQPWQPTLWCQACCLSGDR